MAYTTEAIIRAQTPFKNSTNITATYVARAIADATGIIDAAIGSVYSLPLATVPGVIASLAETITAILLFRQQSSNVELEPGVNVEDAWKTQMELLDAISTRKFKLFDATTGLELALNSSKRLGFYPTQASSDADDINSTAPFFSMNQTF